MAPKPRLVAICITCVVLCSLVLPALSASMEQESARKFNAKPNDIKKQRQQPHLFGGTVKEVSILIYISKNSVID